MLIVSVVGARPQFVKAAPISRAISEAPGISERIVHTGQHFAPEMSTVFFEELGLPQPHRSLGINGGSHASMTGRMLPALESEFLVQIPDLVLVYGDTNSTLAGALAATKLQIPVAHVEAGLRSFNRMMPEEINRVIVDHVSSILLCPTTAAVANLHREGITDDVHHVGDVMCDAALAVETQVHRSRILRTLGIEAHRYRVATVHRAENTASPEQLSAVIGYLRERASELPVVVPLHPRTAQACDDWNIDLDGLVSCAPLGYLDMAALMKNAVEILTDSGGLQKEAYFFGVPCTTLRNETEWIETLAAGWNRLWRAGDWLRPRTAIPDYGDGHAANKILAALQLWWEQSDGQPPALPTSLPAL
jgi:UDP-GlcNAc3NAcA epimerase